MELDAINYIPVIVVTIFILWAYYSYVYELCILTIKQKAKKICYIITLSILIVMINWSFLTTMIVTSNDIPAQYIYQVVNPIQDGAFNMLLLKHVRDNHLQVYQRNESGGIR